MALGRYTMALAEMILASANSNKAEATMLVNCMLYELLFSILIVEVVRSFEVVVETGSETKHCLFKRNVGTASDCQKRMEMLRGKE